jgi:hypothetical protein
MIPVAIYHTFPLFFFHSYIWKFLRPNLLVPIEAQMNKLGEIKERESRKGRKEKKEETKEK